METNKVTEIATGDNITCNNNLPLKGNMIAPPLTIGTDYPVVNVITCDCGSKHIDVGLKSEYNYITCYECKEKLPNSEIHWCHPSRFDIKR